MTFPVDYVTIKLYSIWKGKNGMLKKSFALLAVCLMVFALLASCGKKSGSNKSDLQTDDSVVPTFERLVSKDAAGNVQTVNGSTIYDCYTFESIDSETVRITSFYSQTKGSSSAPNEDAQSYVRCLDPHTVCVPQKLANRTVVKISELAFYTRSEISDLVLPETLTEIENCAFAGCCNLRSVTLPSSVTALGMGAFYNCTSLTSLRFASSSALDTIPQSAFADCSALTEINIPGYIKTIGQGAFLNCTSVTTLTLAEGLTTIEDQAFQNLDALAAAPALPSTVTKVGNLNPWAEK